MPVEKYEAAATAEKALIAAKQSYRDAMAALGAIQKERGNYEDYQTWLKIPGIPDKKLAKSFSAVAAAMVEKYEAAATAEKALIAAKQSYRDAMAALGAIQKERGNYEDYQTWLEIPGIPDKKWSDE